MARITRAKSLVHKLINFPVRRSVIWGFLLGLTYLGAVRINLYDTSESAEQVRELQSSFNKIRSTVASHVEPQSQQQELTKQTVVVKIDLAQSSANSNGHLVQEVERVLHFPHQYKIVIQLKKEGRVCLRPKFMGRLAGPYLGMIRWEENNATQQDEVVGYYSVRPARYNIEIVGLLCNDLDEETNLKKVCLEDPVHNRITGRKARLVAVRQQQPVHENPTALPAGYWKKEGNPYEIFHTRYQPQGCRSLQDRGKTRCMRAMSLDRFKPYTFEFRNPKQQQGSFLHGTGHENKTVCLLGWSHSRVLAEHVIHLLEKHGLNDTIDIHHVGAKYPVEISPDFVKSEIIAENKCNVIIISLAQWPLAGKGHRVPTGAKYRKQMAEVITNIQKDAPNVRLYIRSAHYNPLGDFISACPARDWRSPPAIDLSNSVLRGLANAMKVGFLDTNFIIQPMWDSAFDWNHYTGKVSYAEAMYVLHQVLTQRERVY